MSSCNVCIIRDGSGQSDDLIDIYPAGERMFTVSYTDAGGVQYTFTTNAHGVKEYLEITLDLLKQDDRPFDCIQFNIPAYPCIMIDLDHPDNPEFRSVLWRSLCWVLNDWPTCRPITKDSVPGVAKDPEIKDYIMAPFS
jgi:hypothetical protein